MGELSETGDKEKLVTTQSGDGRDRINQSVCKGGGGGKVNRRAMSACPWWGAFGYSQREGS